MFYNVLKAKDIVNLDDEKFMKKTLMEQNDSCLSIIALKKEEIIDTHTSVCDAAVYVLEGEIELHFDAENSQSARVKFCCLKKMNSIKFWQIKTANFFLLKYKSSGRKFIRPFVL